MIFDAVEKGLPRRVDDVFADANRAEDAVRAFEFDDDADFGGGGGGGVDDADFVVDEAKGVEGGVLGDEGVAEGVVEGVDGAVAFGGGVDFAAFDVEGERGLGERGGIAGAGDGDAVVVEIEERAVLADLLADDEFEGGLGGFELEAFGFESRDFVKDFLCAARSVSMLNFLPALAAMLEMPESSETRMRRWLPTDSGGTCS